MSAEGTSYVNLHSGASVHVRPVRPVRPRPSPLSTSAAPVRPRERTWTDGMDVDGRTAGAGRMWMDGAGVEWTGGADVDEREGRN